MRRRDFIKIVSASAAAWPLAARAQQPTMPVIGFLGTGSPQSDAFRVAAVRQGLIEAGYVEGRNVAFEYRWAEDHYERLPALAAELVRREVAVIASIGGITSAVAAKSATATIPIVFEIGGDPIKLGLVASLSRPGGNITGVSFLVGTLAAKQFEVLHETVPKAVLIGFLVNPTIADAETQTKNALAGRRRSVKNYWSCRPARTASWRRPLSRWSNSVQVHSLSAVILSSAAGPTSSLNWQHIKKYRRSIFFVSLWRPAA